ncbi:MAG: acyl-[acyl-carrier-protein] thioesterase [Clostridium sp.]|uniref:acyl-[acyl-carrier-protein] thioesterase n=1 Tax=Clostridium sp. DSM 8431 TaxID=1761781 RepID=UPI0008EE700C|nr:acyl-ACP thioesterase domain-containing protein [Clostridium sp. DSM 8431]MCR4943305.1 acyl-[acyl-carrier-protein] thioesterase [Clostridium sp.]SFU62692.1 Acyl-ACP thioesterase [Clostridium sp. DSM 8431]
MAKIYTKTYDINYSDVDPNLKCRISSILNFICDVGTNQSEVLGDTIEKLTNKDYVWVFYKYDVQMYSYPSYREKISITTEPFGFKKFYAYRKYTIKNEQGELIGEAVALFFLISISRRRPIRIPKEEYELYDLDLEDSDYEMDDITTGSLEENVKEFKVRYGDIDSNRHVNNVKYVEWAIESAPYEVIENYKIGRVKVIFEKETVYGDDIKVSCSLVSNDEHKVITSHIITNNEGKEITKLELQWVKE